MAERDGGPAFPISTRFTFEVGMSLRDYFAGKALGPIYEACARGLVISSSETADEIARAAYIIADAMLKAREPMRPNPLRRQDERARGLVRDAIASGRIVVLR